MQIKVLHKKQFIKKITLLLILLSALVIQQDGYSQKQAVSKTDSLFSVLKTQKDDTARVNTLNAIAYEFRNSDPDTTLHFAGEALTLAQKLNFKAGMAESHLNKGLALVNIEEVDKALKNDSDGLKICEEVLASENPGDKTYFLKLKRRAYTSIGNIIFYQGNFQEALKNYLISLKISEDIGDEKSVAALNANIANVYIEEGNYPEALKSHLTALKIWETSGSKTDIGRGYNNIARVYNAMNNYKEALKMYNDALKLMKETGDKLRLTEIYNNIGGVYGSQGNYSSALENLSESLKISLEIGDDRNIGNTYVNIGNLYLQQKKYTEALTNYFAALKVLDKIRNNPVIAPAYIGIGNVYTSQGKYTDALTYFNKGLVLSKEMGSLESIKNAYEGLSTLDSARGNFKQSLEHYKLFVSYRDSLFNEDITKKTVQTQMQYDFDKKESAVKAEQDKKDVLTNAEITKQKIIRNFSIAGVIGIVVAGGYMFYNFRKRKKLENLQALSSERLRISRELHDDIGSTLGSIAVYSDVAKNRSLKNGNPAEVLSKIGTASRELIEKMSDIVWSLNPDNESFDQLQNRMQAFAAMILTPQEISFEFKNEGELKTLELTNEQRKNLFLIYKEAVHNIVKYAGCKNVVISFSKSGNGLSFLIKDDGKGFDARLFEEGRGEAYNGNGLKNMKTRAAEMKASLTITSGNNEGTTVELKLS